MGAIPMRDLLLEIGVEELPASHLQPAVEFLRASFEKNMRESGLAYAYLTVSSTPRRLFLLAKGLQENQADLRIKVTGPAQKISFDSEGNLLPPALGFLKKNSASAADIIIETAEKGDFIALDLLRPGRNAADILKGWAEMAIPQIPFPKNMVWNQSRLRFSRPIRWLCAVWGEDVLPLDIAGVSSSRQSRGNRWLGLGRSLDIPSPGQYLEILRRNAVIADRDERRALLTNQLGAVSLDPGQTVVPDPRLVDTVTDLVEYPEAVAAKFDAGYLALPAKIITSTISQNQKYFSVAGSDGALSDNFVFVSNGDSRHSGLIRKGNEKVVAARLADAMWYFNEDTKVPLESYLPRLADVVFQSKLGTMAERVHRIQAITDHLSHLLMLAPGQAELARRTALLCKADLVTNMLGEKEFTKLQGYMGKQYALASGEPEEVAEGIYEHYMPRGNNDGLPQTLSGAIVAVADKLDSVCGIIAVGLVPTGSADPFALRRAANGVVQIVSERGWEMDFSQLLIFCLQLVQQSAKTTPEAEETIRGFFAQRVYWLLTQANIAYDVIDSVAHLNLGSLPDLKRRAGALQEFRSREDFLRLVIGFKRASNIIAGEQEFTPVSEPLLADDAEKQLHASLQSLRGEIDRKLESSDYMGTIALLVEFGRQIDRFFDEVLVNCEDQVMRSNRHSLLNEVKQEFLRVADLSRIVIENESPENKS